jgi:hypothetical protein
LPWPHNNTLTKSGNLNYFKKWICEVPYDSGTIVQYIKRNKIATNLKFCKVSMTCAGNGGSDNNKEFKYLKCYIKFLVFAAKSKVLTQPFRPHPSLPSPVRKLDRRHTGRPRNRGQLADDREGEGVGRGAKPYDVEKACSSTNPSIVSASNSLGALLNVPFLRLTILGDHKDKVH